MIHLDKLEFVGFLILRIRRGFSSHIGFRLLLCIKF